MLYIVSTPIGNLKDITYRAVEVLSSADYILCEDTTHSPTLLKTYNIQKPLYSYHKFNEAEKLDRIIDDLKKNMSIALISDAGTPGICDPGQRLILRCIEEGLPHTVVPGPCALVAALSLSGLSEEKFQFVGFLPKKESEIKKLIQYQGITICYESPHRLLKTLTLLEDLPVTVVREITKLYEECKKGSAKELFEHYTAHPPRGEIVLLITGGPTKAETIETEKEALKLIAKLRGVPKREIYKIFHLS